jgi:hypothetical protein
MWHSSLPPGHTVGPTEMHESSKFNMDVHCYEFLNAYRSKINPTATLEMPPFYKEQQFGFGGMFKKHAN